MENSNLIPVTERSKEEARELGRRGGIASGKARLRKKRGRELLRALLAMPETDPRIIEEMKRLGIADKDIVNEVVAHARQLEKAKRKADTFAYKAVMQVAGYMNDEETADRSVAVNIVVESKEQAAKIADIGKLG